MTVNQQLWTVPFELECYIAICVLAFIGITKGKRLFLVTVIAMQIVAAYKCFFSHTVMGVVTGGHILIFCFLIGVFFYTFRVVIPYNKWIFVVCLCVSVLLFSVHRGSYFIAFPVVYCTVFLGITNPRKIWPIETGDYSYGLYLYGFPIQQTVAGLGLAPFNPWLNLTISYVVTLVLAVASWHLWEKHWLNLRKLRPAIDRAFQFTAPGAVIGRLRLNASAPGSAV